MDRFVAGACTDEEINRLEELFEQYNLTEKHLKADSFFRPDAVQSARMQQAVLDAISPQRKTISLAWVRSIAAVFIGVLLMGTWFAFGTVQNESEQLKVVTNNSGAIEDITLSDGTTVWLNKGASLAWDDDEDFAENRNVLLQGEAYFEVAHDAAHPFVVAANGVKTKVLGTSFNIHTDSASRITQVALFTGKVQLSAKGLPAKLLLPGQSAVYQPGLSHWNDTTIATHTLSWKDREFVCDNEPMEEVVDYLSHYYHKDIILTQDLKTMKCSGSISLKDSLPAVLDQLLFVHQLHYRKEGATIIIH